MKKKEYLFFLTLIVISLKLYAQNDLWVSVEDYRDKGEEDYEVINQAINSGSIAYLEPDSVYIITNSILIGNHKTLYIPGSSTIKSITDADIPTIKLTGGAKLFGSGVIKRENPDWDLSNPKIGIMVTQWGNEIDLGGIVNFDFGIYLLGENARCAYNNISIRYIHNSIQAIKLDAFDDGSASSYVNQNVVHVDNVTVNSDFKDSPEYNNSYGIYMDSHTKNRPDGNRFSGSIEGVKKGIRLCGRFNRLDGLRFELYEEGSNRGNVTIVEIDNYTGMEIYGNNDVTTANWWFGENGWLSWDRNVKHLSENNKGRSALRCYGVSGIPMYEPREIIINDGSSENAEWASRLKINRNGTEKGGGLWITNSTNINDDNGWFAGIPFGREGFSLSFDSNGEQHKKEYSKLYINTSGQVGIGTNSPSEKLDIDGSIRLPIGEENQIGSVGEKIQWGWSNGPCIQVEQDYDDYDAQSILFKTNGGAHGTAPHERIRIKSNGKVGINNSVPDELLDVNGNIKCKKLLTEEIVDSIESMGIINTNSLPKLSSLNSYKLDTKQLKENKNIMPYYFNANNLESQFPELVNQYETGKKSIDYISMIPILVQAIKEQNSIINELKYELEKIRSSDNITFESNSNKLYQAIPTPSNTDEIKIEYYIVETTKSSFIIFYNLQGTPLMKKYINQTGKGEIFINRNVLNGGVIFYSLYVDNQEIDTKKLIITDL